MLFRSIVPMLKVFNETARYVNQCFATGTLVIANGKYKTVESISVGDKLLNAVGGYRPVLGISKKRVENKLLYRIITEIAPEGVLVTGEHEILVYDTEQNMDLYLQVSEIERGRHLVGYPHINTFNFDDICLSSENKAKIGRAHV